MRHKSLIEMYAERKEQPTPAAAFIAEIAEVTHHSIAAARKWVLGLAVPDVSTKILLSKHFGIPYDVLFPISGKGRNKYDKEYDGGLTSTTL